MTLPTSFDPFRDVRLTAIQRQPLQSLKQFRNYHRVPDQAGPAEAEWLHQLAADEIDSRIEEIHGKLRTAFELKRKQLQASEITSGCGRIETPFFDYELHVELDADAPSRFGWFEAITRISDPDQVCGRAFQSVFQDRFRVLEIRPAQAIDVASVIDAVEDEEGGDSLEYDRNASYCRWRFADEGAQVQVEPDRVMIAGTGSLPVATLFERFMEIQARLAAALRFEPPEDA